jgi:hypothetical protein
MVPTFSRSQSLPVNAEESGAHDTEFSILQFRQFAASLQGAKHLRSFTLSHVRFVDGCVAVLSAALQCMPQLDVLGLAHCGLQHDDIAELSHAFLAMPALRQVDM